MTRRGVTRRHRRTPPAGAAPAATHITETNKQPDKLRLLILRWWRSHSLFVSTSARLRPLFLRLFSLFSSYFCSVLLVSSSRINRTVHAKNIRDGAYASNATRGAYPSSPPFPSLPALICLAFRSFGCLSPLLRPLVIRLNRKAGGTFPRLCLKKTKQ